MKYITVKEAAEKWGISARTAQQYCTEGRIEGAAKFSGSWAIPENAKKPSDPRKKAEKNNSANIPQNNNTAKSIPMPLLNTTFVPGHCKEAIDKIEDENQRNIALCEYYYFSGQSEKASNIAEQYLEHPDMALRFSAYWIYAYSNLALDRTDRTRHVMADVKKFTDSIDENTPPELRALAVCVSAGANILLHLPLSEEHPPLNQFVYLLPPGLRIFALYVQAHQAYLQREYGASIGIVETALMLEGEVYPIPSIYLHLMATMNYMSLRHPEKAKKHLLAAWELAKYDDLIEAFGEHHGLIGGMLEAAIKKDYPNDFRRMIAITYSFSAGWRKIHNPDTGHSVADNLTTTEFAASMLAARDWSNKEIAAHMGISENTVKNHIATALQKLNISQRKELRNFMLH